MKLTRHNGRFGKNGTYNPKHNDRRFGKHIHILDWSLHLDEATPHIHERHVFDCENRYGEIAPQQEKALEALGFDLPDPGQKPGKLNNRKKTFDAACRAMLFEICEKHGLHLDQEPEYGGREYLEKQDYILMKQKEKLAGQAEAISEQETKLDNLMIRIEDTGIFLFIRVCFIPLLRPCRQPQPKGRAAVVAAFAV